MAMDEYEGAAALIEDHDDEADFDGPKSQELIELAERAAGLRFPPTYRRFLAEYGAGSFGSTEIYGVIDEDFEHSSTPDAIWLALTHPRAGLFVFHAVGDGTEFCLDTTRAASDGEMPVVAVHPDGDAREEVAPDFGSALLMLVREALGLDVDD
jgi:antitoxin YobK